MIFIAFSLLYFYIFGVFLDEGSQMSAFFSPISTVYLEGDMSTNLEIHFLPFTIGERQCSVIFVNESIGEFLYSIEAKSTLPLPNMVPFVKTSHSYRISSAAAAGSISSSS